MMALMPGFCFAQDAADSTVLNRLWSHAGEAALPAAPAEQNVYMNYNFHTNRRNFTLWLIPTMYSIASGDRDYIGEFYGRMDLGSGSRLQLNRQLECGTIPSYRDVMPVLMQYMMPSPYNESLYRDLLLSPFHRQNRHFYRYKVYFAKDKECIIHFKPRLNNTQLVRGHAVVDTATGYLKAVVFEGSSDMVKFKNTVMMNTGGDNRLQPAHCTIDASFKFLGNSIKAATAAYYNCPTTLPDSIRDSHDRALMDSIRPVSLTPAQQAIYDRYDREHPGTAPADSTAHRSRSRAFRDFMWNVVGDNLVNSIHATAKGASLRISPLLNPLYFGYSQSRGISYRLNIGARYAWNAHRFLTLSPQLGYNFKLRQFYYKAPLRMTYNPKRNGYAELTWANGNRVNNGKLISDVRQRMGQEFTVPEYKDQYLLAVNNVEAFDWIEVMTGVAYHRRSSTNKALMREVGMQPVYRSFAPLLTLRLTPWQDGPTLTANYTHAFPRVMRSDLQYDRWEFDLAYKRRIKCLRAFNLRVGTGFYTSRNSDYFADFDNFQDNNLVTGWDDDWTGQFQLVDSRWYNESDYYLRANLSYESPLLALTWLPWLGKALETERIYFSALSIEHTRPYFEVGYGFTCRFFSTGIFASFLNTKYERFGCRVTLELFRKW